MMHIQLFSSPQVLSGSFQGSCNTWPDCSVRGWNAFTPSCFQAASTAPKVEQVLSGLEQDVLNAYLDGKSYQEIADMLGRHVKSIDNALQRVKRKLEKSLAESKAQEDD